ncbi:MAG: LysR family transcriptional regulator, partial [Cyanobacteria bacterium J06576_12]
MDISVLKLFVEVVRQGSFAAVARDRNVDPSSVSRAIASLETELGIRLFQRTTRQLSPTEAGTLYFERVEPLVEEIQLAGEMAADAVTLKVPFGRSTTS